MRKFLFVLTFLFCYAIFSPLKAQNCPFRVKLKVDTATCFNNGKVIYALTDESGNVLTTTPTGLSEIRAYYIEETGAKHYSGMYLVDPSGNITASGYDTMAIPSGTFTVGVEGLCWDGSNYVKLDTNTLLNIPTTYVKPFAIAMSVTAKTFDGYGRRPTLDCDTTGRIQLKITNGKFPYMVTVVDHTNGDTLRTVTIDGRQYNGTNASTYNYKDYYTFDSMPAGDWDFYLVDGCDYGLPRTGQKVEVVDFPLLDYVNVYASSGNMQDSNVVKITAVLDKDYSYYSAFLPLVAEYRFLYDGVPSSDWKPFPPVSGYSTVMYDTVESANKYCDIWNKNITLQYKRKQCDTITVSKTFHLYKPNENYFHKDSSDIIDSNYYVNGECPDKYYWHRWFHCINYPYKELNISSLYEDHYVERHHYTLPVTWVYYDTERHDTIKTETFYAISDTSYLYDRDLEAKYGSFQSYTLEHPLMLPIQRSLIDAHGCVLYSSFDSLPYCYDIGELISDWEFLDTIGDHCCTELGRIWVKEHYHSEVDPDGTTVRLSASPYSGLYNFTAVYSSATHS